MSRSNWTSGGTGCWCTAPLDQQVRVKQTIEQLDAEASPETAEEVRFYATGAMNPTTLLPILQKLAPDMQLEADATSRRIVAWGMLRDHEILAKTIDRFLTGESGQRLATRRLSAARSRRRDAHADPCDRAADRARSRRGRRRAEQCDRRAGPRARTREDQGGPRRDRQGRSARTARSGDVLAGEAEEQAGASHPPVPGSRGADHRGGRARASRCVGRAAMSISGSRRPSRKWKIPSESTANARCASITSAGRWNPTSFPPSRKCCPTSKSSPDKEPTGC